MPVMDRGNVILARVAVQELQRTGEKKKTTTTKHSVAQQQHHSFKIFLKCLLWDFTILQENCCKYDLIRQNSISLDCHAII